MLTSAAINKSLITKSLVTGASGSSQYCQLLYNGASGSYHVNVTLGVANETWDYTLVNLDNNSLDIDLGVHGSFYSFDYTFPDVDFQFQFTENTEVNSGEFFAAGPVFSIYSKPTDPPTGLIPLYRYDNPELDRHMYTSDWNELGSFSQGYQFEKVQGYLYTSATGASNLVPLYRYYNSTTSDHYLTTTNATYSGYTYEKILGYISTTPITSADQSLNEYFDSTSGHVYTSPPETLSTPFVFSALEGYLTPPLGDVINGGLTPLYRYYNGTTARHVYTNTWSELGSGAQGYTFEKVQGYMYDNSSRANNLTPLYRYYSPGGNDHYMTTVLGNYTGYNYEEIMGYVSTVSTSSFDEVLNQYFCPSNGHVYTSPPENLTSPFVFYGNDGYLMPATPLKPPLISLTNKVFSHRQIKQPGK